MANPDCSALLDQLQSQVNLVLEQAGRVFAAVNNTSTKPPTAQVNKLKQIIPRAQNNFHEALDQLEEELQLAQIVLRRDLALFREKAGHQTHATVAVQTAHQRTETADSASLPDAHAISTTDGAHIGTAPVPGEDVAMEDAEPEQQTDIVTKAEPKVESADRIHTPKPEPIDVKTAPSTGNHDPEDTHQEARGDGVAAPTSTEAPDAKPADSALQLDTAPPTINPPEDEKAPGTAKESITNDLESLFGGGDTSNEPNSDFTFEENATGEIDFGDFTSFGTDNGDNDNISSLLPGLEDYANTQSNASGADLDLSSFFNTNTNDANNAANQPAASEQRDTTFDDLMDLANYDGTAMGDDANNTTDLADFESLFN